MGKHTQGSPQPRAKLKGSLGYRRPSADLKKQKFMPIVWYVLKPVKNKNKKEFEPHAEE